MIRLALRGISTRKTRAALTAIAVLLGVTMISGTYVFSDTINAAFKNLFDDASKGADVVVSGREAVSSQFNQPATIPEKLVKRIRRVPGVKVAEGQVQGLATIVGRDGDPVQTGGSPAFAVSAMKAPFQSLKIAQGRLPARDGQIAIDTATAEKEGFKLGQDVVVATQKPKQPFRLVGTVDYGNVSLGGTTVTVFTLHEAQLLFLKQRKLDTISISSEPGVSARELVARIRPVLPESAQVRTAAEQADEQSSQITDQLSVLTTGLLAFGFIAVFVGAFIIFNTFSITVAQRIREFALLRTLGATRAQVLFSVIIEALAIGLVASFAGLWLGLLFADLIASLLSAIGVDLPSTDEVLLTRTVIVCLVVGTVVTLVASLIPALRSTRVTPMEALRTGVKLPRSRLARVVPVLGLLLGLGGAALLIAGLLSDAGSADQRLASSAAGAIVLVIGIAVLSPRLVPGVARAVGWPLERITRLVGRLARANATRNPGRTAVTAAALMIGLALVLFVTVFANGLRVSSDEIIDRSFAGDFAVSNTDGFSPIPVGTAGAVAQVIPGGQVSAFKFGESRLAGANVQTNGFDPATISEVYNFDWVEGSNALLGALGATGVLLERNTAEERKLSVGDRVQLTAPTGKRRTVVVRGVYDDPALLPGMAMALSLYNQLFDQNQLAYLLVKKPPDVSEAEASREIDRALEAFPGVTSRSQQGLKDEQAQRVNQILALFYALLAMSVLVALFGIVNTLTLSIYERTRELGMMRAVGMSRRQVRRMIRYESVITAAIGAVLGLLLGVFFAWIVTRAVASEGIVFAIPWGQVAGLLVLALLAGVVAAVLPARRASRLDVLQAIAYE